MLSILRQSLRAKVIAVVFISTLAALVVSTVALLLYEVNTYRDFLTTDLRTQANILSRMNAPALQFDDPDAAAANLALLDRRRSFEAAAIYTESGEVVASYSRDNDPLQLPAVGPLDQVQMDGGSLILFEPIIENGNRLGTVYLRAGYDLAARAWAYLMILVAVMLLGLGVAAGISLSLAASVTRPVRAVTQTARRVIQQRDFSIRAPKTSTDEIGLLVDAFNTMLDEVGARTTALESTNQSLHAESQMRRKIETDLRTADRRKDEFLATLAHELRNPLAPLVNAVTIAKSEPDSRDAAHRSIAIIDRQVTQLVRLVDDLLDVSRITSGKLEIRRAPVRLRDVVQNALDTIGHRINARDHSVRTVLPDRHIFVYADAARLAQVIGNLLHNAVKFSEPNGEIALIAEIDDGMVRISVSDEGVGISADTVGSIFEMFTQGSNLLEHAQTGLGVGLALARQLTELHGGTIQVESPGPGKGARFTVTIPIADSAPEAQSAAVPERSESGEPARILVVDDNVDFAQSLAELLGAGGHDVRVAHTGEEALTMASEFRPELGLLDIGLPDIDGYELARRLRALPWAGDLILIAVSGWGQEQDRQRSREAGFKLHMVKPVPYPAVQAALRNLRENGTA